MIKGQKLRSVDAKHKWIKGGPAYLQGFNLSIDGGCNLQASKRLQPLNHRPGSKQNGSGGWGGERSRGELSGYWLMCTTPDLDNTAGSKLPITAGF
jgi:hypothetical protein